MAASTEHKVLKLSSPAFENENEIPAKYTCDGKGISPPLKIEFIPDGTSSLALIAEDPDAPGGTYDHWIVWNIDPRSFIDEKINPGIDGKNSGGKTGYHPPCPPDGSHRYYFHIYALDATLELRPGADRKALEKAMQSHVLSKATLMGYYARK